MSLIKKLSLALAVIGGFSVFTLATPVAVQAQDTTSVCQGIALSGQDCDPAGTTVAQDGIQKIIKTVIDIFSIVVGAVSVIMVIIGGFRYIVSAGDSSAVSGAKNTILYALIGLVIVIFARTIVTFVIGRIG